MQDNRPLYLKLWNDKELKTLINNLHKNKIHSKSDWYKRNPVEYVTHIFTSYNASILIKKLILSSSMGKINNEEVRFLKNRRYFEILMSTIPNTMRFQQNGLNCENLLLKGIPTTHAPWNA